MTTSNPIFELPPVPGVGFPPVTGPAGPNVVGTAVNDALKGTAGDNAVDGGAGLDTLIYAAPRANFTVSKVGSGYRVADTKGSEGTDTLTGVERLQFSDRKVALDLGVNEAAGQALLWIGMLAPSLVTNAPVVGTILDLFDQGKSMKSMFQLALDVGLVSSIAGSNSNAAVASMAFRNLVGAEADAATVDLLVSYLDGRAASLSQADFLTTLAGFELNQVHIGLVGLQQTGVEYGG